MKMYVSVHNVVNKLQKNCNTGGEFNFCFAVSGTSFFESGHDGNFHAALFIHITFDDHDTVCDIRRVEKCIVHSHHFQ